MLNKPRKDGISIEDIERGSRPQMRIHRAVPSGETDLPTIVFVHGAFSGGWIWAENFQPFFAKRGFPSIAMDLRGRHAINPFYPSHYGLADYICDVEDAVAHVGRPFILIGHSLGGLIAQRFSAIKRPMGLGLVATVPPEGLAFSSWQMALTNPMLFWNTTSFAISPALGDVSVARKALLSPDVSDQVAFELLRRSCPEAPRALMEAQLPMPEQPGFLGDTPVCVLGAENDRLIPFTAIERAASFYNVEAHKLKDVAHAVMIDTRWQSAAQALLKWIEKDVLPRQ